MCCDSGRKPGSCCKNTTEVFTMAAPFSSITAGPATPTNTATSASRNASNPATTTTLSETVTPAASPSSIAPDKTQTTPTAVPKTKTRNGSKIGAAIGGGIGGGIVLGTMALLWLWRRRRNKKGPQRRLKISRPFELPSEDHAFQPNSTLFPAELHPQASKSATSPAELEQKDSLSTHSPAELEHKDSKAIAPAAPTELMAKSVKEPAGPFELHGRQVDSIMVPPSPVKFDETRRWPFTRLQQGEYSSPQEEVREIEVVAKRPSLKRRPGSMSGPWHDKF